MELTTLLMEQVGAVARITMNRPQVLNALNRQMRRELIQLLDALEADRSVRSIILTGAGRAFSAGADVKESGEHRPATPDEWRQHLASFVDLSLKIWNLSKPVVGAINGYALGAGCDLALVTDLSVASTAAKFGEPEISFFSAPPTLLMPWVVGIKKTKELLLTGSTIDAHEAERLGMVNKVVTPEELPDAAMRLAEQLAKPPAVSIKYNKMIINHSYELQGFLHSLRYNLDTSILIYLSESTEERLARSRYIQEHGLKSFHEVGHEAAVAQGKLLLARDAASREGQV